MRAPTTGNAATADASRKPACIGRGQKAMAACAATTNAHGMAEAMRPCMHHGQWRDAATWMLQCVSAPLQRDAHPQPKMAAQRLMKNMLATAAAAAKTNAFGQRSV